MGINGGYIIQFTVYAKNHVDAQETVFVLFIMATESLEMTGGLFTFSLLKCVSSFTIIRHDFFRILLLQVICCITAEEFSKL